MTAIILTFHTLIVLGLIVVVLLQRSDGGALGLGGGGGGGFMSGRGAANALTRTTSILAAIFFTTSIVLAMLARSAGENDQTIIEELTSPAADETPEAAAPAELTTEDVLGTLGGDTETDAPEGEVTASDLDAVLDSLGTEEPAAEEAVEAPDEEAAGEPEGQQ